MKIDINERCPHCGQHLWYELGFMTPQLYGIQAWYNYAYPRTKPLYTMDDIVEVQEEEII